MSGAEHGRCGAYFRARRGVNPAQSTGLRRCTNAAAVTVWDEIGSVHVRVCKHHSTRKDFTRGHCAACAPKQAHQFTGDGPACAYNWPDGDVASPPCGLPRECHQ